MSRFLTVISRAPVKVKPLSIESTLRTLEALVRGKRALERAKERKRRHELSVERVVRVRVIVDERFERAKAIFESYRGDIWGPNGLQPLKLLYVTRSKYNGEPIAHYLVEHRSADGRPDRARFIYALRNGKPEMIRQYLLR